MIELRKVQLTEVETLSNIAIEAYYDHYIHLWFDGGKWYVDKCFNINQLSKEVADLNNEYYLIEEEKFTYGFLKLRPNNPLEQQNGDGFEIERIYLIQEATGKGFGEKIMNFAIQKAKDLGKDYVWLKAMDSSESAIKFYQKLGFQVCGTSTLEFEMMKPEVRGMVTMVKRI